MKTKTPTNRAAIYLRVSTTKQDAEGTSLQTQEETCRAYAAEHDYEVVGVFTDVYSGEDIFGGPHVRTARTAARERRRCRDRARARPTEPNQIHQGLILSEIEYARARLELVTEKLEDTPEGRLLLSVRGFVAEVERVKIRERTNRGRRARAAGGKMMPGPRPLYGYQWRDGDRSALEPNPETAPIVLRIFRELAAGKSMRQVVKGLTDDGIPTATGGTRWEIYPSPTSYAKNGTSGTSAPSAPSVRGGKTGSIATREARRITKSNSPTAPRRPSLPLSCLRRCSLVSFATKPRPHEQRQIPRSVAARRVCRLRVLRNEPRRY